MSAEYDNIGATYTATRAADPRITRRLIELLALPVDSVLIDIGAGSGNYSYALAEHGFTVTAVEPSETMRKQAMPHHNLSWQAATAEALPFQGNAFDGAVMTLCLHHLQDWQQGVREALRVTGGGPLVIFAFEIEHKSEFWLFDYFPEFLEIDKYWAVSIEDLREFVEKELQSSLQCMPFPLPRDLIDHFAAAGWARPEIYLQQEYRSGISSFSRLDKNTIAQRIAKLKMDLETGTWQTRYGHLLHQEHYDGGYLFLHILASSDS